MVTPNYTFKFIFFSLIFLGIFAFVKTQATSLAEEISNRCLTEGTSTRASCLEIEILSELNKNPQNTDLLFTQFHTLLKNHTLTDDPRIFSPIIHDVGMELAFNHIDPALAFTYCGTQFKGGCLHGVVMEYLDDLEASDTGTLLEFCSFAEGDETKLANCIHGVGHELAAKNTDDLNSILKECKKTELPYMNACTSGVFMEFSTGVHGTGRHTHDSPVGSVLLPCEEVTSEFKTSCYVALSNYRQYSPDTETFQKTAETCTALPSEFKNACVLGLADKIFMANTEDLEASNKICETLEASTQEACKNSIKQMLNTTSD